MPIQLASADTFPEVPVKVGPGKGHYYVANSPDRPLSVEEIAAEEGAITYPRKDYPTIKPIPGTIAFFLRNISGGNAAVVEQLKNLLGEGQGDTNRYRKIKEIVILWNRADNNSQRRVDIFDIICDQRRISRRLFWGWFNEALFDFTEEQVKMHLQTHKLATAENILKMAAKERNQMDRKLAAEMTGLVEGSAPKISVDASVNDNRTVNQTVNVPSFVKTIRASETKEIKEVEEAVEPRQLGVGNMEIIDIDFEDVREKELVERR